MAIKTRLDIEPSFNMSSMTDLVFLLLIFFMITSTVVNPNALKLLLPKSTNQITAKTQTSVSIKHHQDINKFTYHINGNLTPVAFETIEDSLRTLLVNDAEPVVALYVDKSVPVEEVVNMMNIAKRNNYKVLLATAPE